MIAAPIPLEHEVKHKLVSLCRSILKKDEIDFNRSFFELGGDSLTQLYFIAGIFREFEVGITTESLLQAQTLGDVKTSIINALSVDGAAVNSAVDRVAFIRQQLLPKPEIIAGEVPLLANRYSYFFRRKRNLEFWNTTTGILKTTAPLDQDIFCEAVRKLVEHHDGLRLQVTRNGEDWRQFIVAPAEANPITTENGDRSRTAAHKQFVEHTAQQILKGFTFPGDLFKVLLLKKHSESLIMIAAHHLLVDAYSFGLVIDDLMDFYQQLKTNGTARFPAKTTSFLDYSRHSTEYWLLHEQEQLSYWRSLPWHLIEGLSHKPGHELANTEQYTSYVLTSFADRHEDSQNRVDVPLCAIAKAYCKWTGHRVLHLALVFHGRESFVEGVDLSRTAGWISETVPVLLNPYLDLPDFLADTHRQVEQAGSRGKSYGVLKYFSADETVRREVLAHPDPEVSLNIIQPGMIRSGLGVFAERLDDFDLGSENQPTTERAFLLSGGIHFRNGSINLSWDFSTELFSLESIQQFTTACAQEYESLISLLHSESNP
jgi:acyl carrier protein